MGNKRIPFDADCVYHVYNHGNAEDIIFREDKNYFFFLKRYRKYIAAIADTYAYCLMPNHFHLMVGIKSEEELNRFFKKKYPKRDPQSFPRCFGADLISNQFKNFLISYAKAFNKMYDRRGSLFLDNLNRNKIEDDHYFTQPVRYIHLNPVKHDFVNEPKQWPHSSYNSYLSDKTSLLRREEVLEWFGGRANFIASHKINPEGF